MEHYFRLKNTNNLEAKEWKMISNTNSSYKEIGVIILIIGKNPLKQKVICTEKSKTFTICLFAEKVCQSRLSIHRVIHRDEGKYIKILF
jgi:hypothetical protein